MTAWLSDENALRKAGSGVTRPVQAEHHFTGVLCCAPATRADSTAAPTDAKQRTRTIRMKMRGTKETA